LAAAEAIRARGNTAPAPAAVEPMWPRLPTLGDYIDLNDLPNDHAAGVPSGYVLVPVEPTIEMRRCADILVEYSAKNGFIPPTYTIYKTMLAAAPTAPKTRADV
jgi:hypothetical protein